MEQNKFFEQLADVLAKFGWERTTQYGVLAHGRLYFVLYREEKSEAIYEFSNTDRCVPSLAGVTVDGQAWHLEYDGFILTFGKLPKYAEHQGLAKKNLDALVAQLNSYVTMDPTALYFCRAIYKVTRKTYDIYRMHMIDSIHDGEIYLEMDKDNLYYLMKNNNDSYSLIKVEDTDPRAATTNIWMDERHQAKRIDGVTKSSIEGLVTGGKAKLFERIPEAAVENVGTWELAEVDPKAIAELFDLTTGYSEFGLDAQHKRYLANALKRKLPVAALLDNSISIATIAGIYTLLCKNIPVNEFNTSFTEEAVDALVRLALDGIPIKKYAVPGYSAARIQKLYSDFATSFESLRSKLKSEGFSQEQIEYIREVAAEGKGISDAYNHDAVLVNRMKALAKTGYFTNLLNFMSESVTEGAAICSVPWSSIPQSLRDEYRSAFETFPGFSSHGYSWQQIIDFCFSKADAVVYRHPFGLMLQFGYYYLVIQDNYIAIRNSGFSNIWIAELINDKVYVNDFDFPRGLWDETDD